MRTLTILLFALAGPACASALSGNVEGEPDAATGDWPDASRANSADGGPGLGADADLAAEELDAGLVGGAPDAADANIVSGGPCMSGAPGASAYRIRFVDAGGQAQIVYEGNGLPDTSRDHAGVFGYQIGFTSSFVDPFLGVGGLQLNSSSFVDIELSTVGLSQISTATLSIFGRSYNTTSSGSFHWQTFVGTGSSASNLVSNAAPYQWYSADMTSALVAGDDGALLRIKAGPSSNSLVVHRIELCVQAT